MVVGIHQPHYLPWLRYVDKIAASDLFILLDDVAFTKNGWQNRNKIKSAGGPQLMTVPVQASLNQRIDEVRIAAGPWACKHLRTLDSNYSHAPHYAAHRPFFAHSFCGDWGMLADLNEAVLNYCLIEMNIRTPIIKSSALSVPGVATERLINLCREVGATAYLTGEFATDAYLDSAAFERAGIELRVHRWSCPTYAQQFPKAGFSPDLSVVDLLFNEGPNSLAILNAGQELQSCSH